ncbi:hypothetical protein ALC56_09442 [Trachymyrmex septentrionalis]|uniref:Uncharacterized protein n=1 Tax=Trachymyrmex septentrionalis TaxID=34720 RepID=A0A195F7X4_9HYME|nr:hypothetical protein ALC56_09442 [Trachymyrmex septentrionalis]
METAGQTLSASLAYSASIRRRGRGWFVEEDDGGSCGIRERGSEKERQRRGNGNPSIPSSSDAGVPTTTHPPPTPSNWRAPEYVLYIHTRALMSVPVLLPALPLLPPPRRRKRKGDREGEREKQHRRVRTVDLERKRDGGCGEGWPKPPLYLSRGTYTRASGTPTSNVVININGAAQYSPDFASLCVYLWSISLLGQASLSPSSPSLSPPRLPPLLFAGRSHAASSPCYGFRVLRRRFTYLVCFGRLKSKGYTRHFLANVRNIEWYLRRNQLSETTRSSDYVGLCPRSLLFLLSLINKLRNVECIFHGDAQVLKRFRINIFSTYIELLLYIKLYQIFDTIVRKYAEKNGFAEISENLAKSQI